MRKQKGFSLIELLIVVAIILIIAAIAIPNLLRSRIAANEASAVGSVRTLRTWASPAHCRTLDRARAARLVLPVLA
jgi:prepilin-type N-terminal cleavage/methylation domain-containing protein